MRIIDGIGFLPMDIQGANLSLQLIAKQFAKTSAVLEAVQIGGGTHPGGKFFVWTASEKLEIRQGFCAFLPCQTKNFLANLRTAVYWHSF